MSSDWVKLTTSKPVPSQKARLTSFLTDAKEAGIPARKAAIVAIVSVNESGVTPFLPQDVPAQNTCYPLRQILRQERGYSRDNTVSMDNRPTDAAIKWLQAQGYWQTATVKGENRWWLELDQLSGSDSFAHPLPKVAHVLLYSIAQREPRLLVLFAIGMTQLWMANSKVCGGTFKGSLETWDDAWLFVTATDVATLFKHNWGYLSTTDTNFPVRGITLDKLKQYYVRYQSGSMDWSKSPWKEYINSALSNVEYVWSVMEAIGYK